MAVNWGRGNKGRKRHERAVVLARDPNCYLGLRGCTIISTVDEHVIGRAAGGSDDLSNRRGACKNCNEIKRKAEANAGRHTTRHPPEEHPSLR